MNGEILGFLRNVPFIVHPILEPFIYCNCCNCKLLQHSLPVKVRRYDVAIQVISITSFKSAAIFPSVTVTIVPQREALWNVCRHGC